MNGYLISCSANISGAPSIKLTSTALDKDRRGQFWVGDTMSGLMLYGTPEELMQLAGNLELASYELAEALEDASIESVPSVPPAVRVNLDV